MKGAAEAQQELSESLHRGTAQRAIGVARMGRSAPLVKPLAELFPAKKVG